MTKEFKDAIPHLNIEVLPGGLIRLENESMGDSYVVDLHPVHLRHIAEKMGLVESSDPTAARTIATLQRRMLALRDRVDNITEWMEKFSDHKQADLTYEMTQLHALQDLACEWCLDFEDEFTPASDTMEDKKQADATQLADKKASPDTDTRQMAMEV